MSKRTYQLADRILADTGTVHLSGIQALSRLPVEQLRADRRAGHRTAAFVSGYQGSPLGGMGDAATRAAKLASDLPIVVKPAVNEEYGATAVMGTQLAMAQPDASYDGVLGIWYGKSPGVDRAADALRHAVYAGTSRLGGAVAFVGDDPLAKSSTLPSSSAGLLADLHIPVLYPGDPAEALDLGRHAVALSRGTGLWSALKIVADVADGTASIDLDPDRVTPIYPEIDGRRYDRTPDGSLLTPHTVEMEREIYEVRYPLAVRYAALNRLNEASVDPPDAWIAIVASGITYFEVREALISIGLRTDDDIASAGIRLIRLRMPLPFDPRRMRELTTGVDEVLVVEEKHPHVESLVKDALYALTERPRIVGKTDEDDRPLLPGWSALDSGAIAGVLRQRLSPRIGDRLAPEPPPARELIPVSVGRTPFYCSGCPHNRSTQVPDGALVAGGIGCHTMALLMDPERVGDISGITCMGNEGTQWIGMQPFIERDHLIQNLGDGTYFHSGQLAVTAAIAAGVDITYKLLWNGTVAMTGGQDPEGQLGLADVVHVLLRQGVSKVLITSDDVDRTEALDLPRGVDVWDRSRLLEAQAHLQGVSGVTVLVHDQACAAEARRARKRGLVPTPLDRVVINERVCEGCGDCGQVSNCLSVQPTMTPFGRKTRIDQTTCNLDYSCLEGDCPSFMTIRTSSKRPSWLRRLRRGRAVETTSMAPATSAVDDPVGAIGAWDLPDPVAAGPTDDVSIRITGVGGTGVVTVSQVMGTAAMLAGFEVRGLDQIGLSQKAGPVVSDLRFTHDHLDHSSRLGTAQADVLLVFDQLVGASERGLTTADPERTAVVGSTSTAPTGAMITHPEITPPGADELAARIAEYSDPTRQWWADAEAVTSAVFGDAVTANIFVVGMAVQAGVVPIPVDRMHEAIALNGVAVDVNTAAFTLGRQFVADRAEVDALVADLDGTHDVELADALRTTIATISDDADLTGRLERYAAELVAFDDERRARAYLARIREVAERERAVVAGSTALTGAVADQLFKLTAYKDEYEVARLLTDDDAIAAAREMAGPDGSITYRLHPPLLKALGLDRKIGLSERWAGPVLRVLAKGKFLRGTPLDPFGWAKVRRLERRLPKQYDATVSKLLAGLSPESLDAAVEIATLPDLVRGYEDLKLRRIDEYRTRTDELLATYPNR